MLVANVEAQEERTSCKHQENRRCIKRPPAFQRGKLRVNELELMTTSSTNKALWRELALRTASNLGGRFVLALLRLVWQVADRHL